MSQRNAMASKEQIVEYWQERVGELGPGPFPSSASTLSDEECFACGDHMRIERAHIVPDRDGGSPGPKNLHLLCRRCHFESDHLAPSAYWHWLRGKRASEWKHPLLHAYDRVCRAGFDARAHAEDVLKSMPDATDLERSLEFAKRYDAHFGYDGALQAIVRRTHREYDEAQ